MFCIVSVVCVHVLYCDGSTWHVLHCDMCTRFVLWQWYTRKNFSKALFWHITLRSSVKRSRLSKARCPFTFEGHPTTLVNEGTISGYVNPATQHNTPEEQDSQHQHYRNLNSRLLRSYEVRSMCCLAAWHKACFNDLGRCVIHLVNSLHYKVQFVQTTRQNLHMHTRTHFFWNVDKQDCKRKVLCACV